MYKYLIKIGLNDRKTKKEKFTPEEAHEKLNRILLNHFNIYAFTMMDCYGCYKHNNGKIVMEKTVQIEIASDEKIDDLIRAMVKAIKHKRCFNQESIMVEYCGDCNIKFH